MSNVKSGTISWVDLSTPDIEGAKRFYADLLSWDLDVRDTSMGSYVVVSSGGRQVAGMMAQSQEMAGAPATWTIFVLVDDMDATLAGVTGAGGAVVQTPFEVPGGARVAVVADPSGAMFALISGGPEPDYPYLSDEPGTVCWAELMTGDVERATQFYHDVFGWTAETDNTGPVPYTVCRLDGDEVAGVLGRPDNVPTEAPDCWSVYFAVTDCKAAEQQAVDLGGSVILSATPTPAGPFAVLADPAGAAFQIMEMAAPPDQ